MSSAYQNMINSALQQGRALASAGVEKTASDPSSIEGLIKEGEEVANALEYMAIASVDDGTAVGTAKADMVKDFFKAASKQRHNIPAGTPVPHGTTQVRGTQAIAPSNGKRRIASQNGGAPVVSTAPSGPGMLESFKQAQTGQPTLEDILFNKQAMSPSYSDPQVSAAHQYTNTTNRNENRVRSVLGSNSSAENFQRRDVHGSNIRARLSEAFGATNDSLADSTASRLFPQAHARGGMKKTAGTSRTRQRLARLGKSASAQPFMQSVAGRALGGGALGAAAGGIGGYAAGGDAQSAMLGAGLGAAGGAATGGLMQRGALQQVGHQQGAYDDITRALQAGGHQGTDPAQIKAMEEAAAQASDAGAQAPGSMWNPMNWFKGRQPQQAAPSEQEIMMAKRMEGANDLEQLNPEQAAEWQKRMTEGENAFGQVGQQLTPEQIKAIQANQEALQAAQAGAQGMGMPMGVAASGGALLGLGAGVMGGQQKQANSPLSGRSRLRQMQRGL